MDASKASIVIFLVAAVFVSTIYSACQPPAPAAPSCGRPSCPKQPPCRKVTLPCQRRVIGGGCGGGIIMPRYYPMGGMIGGMMGGMMRPPTGGIGLPGTGSCTNSNVACTAWAAKGHCTTKLYYRYMSTVCCLACRMKLEADKTGPGGGTAPKTPTGTATGTGTAPAVAVKPAPAVVKPAVKPAPTIDLAAINAAAVAKAKADAEKKKAAAANTEDLKKLVEAAQNAAKAAQDAANKIAAAQALAKLGNQGKPAGGAPANAKPADVKNTGNTAGPDKTPIDPKVIKQLIDAFQKSG